MNRTSSLVQMKLFCWASPCNSVGAMIGPHSCCRWPRNPSTCAARSWGKLPEASAACRRGAMRRRQKFGPMVRGACCLDRGCPSSNGCRGQTYRPWWCATAPTHQTHLPPMFGLALGNFRDGFQQEQRLIALGEVECGDDGWRVNMAYVA